MSNPKNKPGIHLFKDHTIGLLDKPEPYWYWHARASNGRITANGETYSRRSTALNSIRSTAVTLGGKGKFKYFDHSKKDSPLVNFPG
jgi:uncharacterized protein YegP (UPF0339 family)